MTPTTLAVVIALSVMIQRWLLAQLENSESQYNPDFYLGFNGWLANQWFEDQ